MSVIADSNVQIRQYLLITASYWAFTLTDGALRMLVVLYFHQRGYSPLDIAFLFLFYEFFGVVTNLLGGWLGARVGLNRTLHFGIGLQLVALGMLLFPDAYLTVLWVMSAQAVSGIAKDLNKMSAKSAVKLLVPADDRGRLYRLIAALTGSKNTLKGLGFFLGGSLLSLLDFQGSILVLILGLSVIWGGGLVLLKKDLGKATLKPPFSHILSKSPPVNALSAARFFLFGARDIWFVVALPVHLATAYYWGHAQVGGFLALWIIGYGAIQAIAPRLTGLSLLKTKGEKTDRAPDGATVTAWALPLALIPLLMTVTPGVANFPGTETLFWSRSGRTVFASRVTGIRRSVCCKFFGTQLPYRQLRQKRSSQPRRGLLLHGKCRWATCGHHTVGLAIPNIGFRSLSGYVQRVSVYRSVDFTGSSPE